MKDYRGNSQEATLVIKSYHRDVVLSFKYPSYSTLKRKTDYCRGKIKDFSLRSARRLKLVARNIAPKMKATIDLTYPNDFPVDGKTVKKHYSKFRKRLRRLGINSLWVLEFQKRGAPHFHLMVDSEIDKELVSKMWFEIVDSVDEKHLKAATRVQAIKDEGQVIRYI